MTRTTAQRRRRVAARLAPLLIALGALPLMAPTCGSPGEGSKVFAQGSLIIPMDVCYQYQTDADRSSYTPAATCPQAVDPGNVIRAYGLVYELIRNGVAVYWVIDNGKTAVTGIDLAIQYNGGVPVYVYDWASDTATATPTASHLVNYRGGPFVVDGSDAARARAVMQQFRGTFQNVNVHVANVSFKGYAKRTMAGGWSAGGAVPPKLALLDIGSSGAGAKNSEVVIQGYLTQAGLDTAGASGSATGTHGAIYDRLEMPDFIPTVAGDWTRTNLHRNGYQILWVPHWAAPSSCSDCPPSTSCTCSNKYDPVTISSALKTIGAFVANGGDLFAECAGLGSFEGVFQNGPTDSSKYSPTYVVSTTRGPEPTTVFETVASPKVGFWIETNTPSGAYLRGNFNSPFMQLGDYPFLPHSGAISDFRAAAYDPNAADSTVRLISETSTDPGYDLFTMRPRTASRGTIVYLGGHSYSGQDGNFQIAGTRLVLNTLFNLGAGCTGDGVACTTGLLGVCAAGHFRCNASGQPECVPDVQPGTRAETCNGLDDNCNGEIDEDLTNPDCYDLTGFVDPDGRSTTGVFNARNTGVCRPGVSTCVQQPDGSWGMSACVGQVLPAAETCNGLDDDCNGLVDDRLAQACYDGPDGTLNVGECKAGAQLCFDGAWGSTVGGSFVPGACGGEVLPVPEICGDGPGNGRDDNCNGRIDEGCTCTSGTTQPCFTGPGTPNVGICRMGTQSCTGGSWGECSSVNANVVDPEPCSTPARPAAYVYVPADDWNCDGKTTQCTECVDGANRSCWGEHYDPAAPSPLAGHGQCTLGTQRCQNGTWGATVSGSFLAGACSGYGHQSVGSDGSPIEYCDNVDNNCNGAVDENAICPARYRCVSGVCVPGTCGPELPAPEGYSCVGGLVVQSSCGTSTCAAGQLCQYSSCVDPCPVSTTELDPETLRSASLVCGIGTSCGGGACVGGGCYEAGCPDPAKPLCRSGACVADPCAGTSCPSGTFCREGFCVQACVFVSCFEGQRCGPDGFCVADACAGVSCGAGQRCNSGRCVADPCASRGCATGQVCDSSSGQALCVDDPCTDITCPAGVCVEGQCFSSSNRTGVGSASKTSTAKKGCGCASGAEAAWPALLGLLLAPLRRRRARAPAARGARGGRRGGPGLALALLAGVTLLSAPGCKKTSSTTEFDPSQCTQTCGEQRCVDVLSDPGHCGKLNDAGACNHACGSGERCGDGVCGPSGLVAPFVAALSPAAGAKDAEALAVTLTGERFKEGATVRVATNGVPRTLACPAAAGGDCQWVSAGTLHAVLDLTGAVEGSWTLRVVNPDLVISNAVTLGVYVPVPSVTGVTPGSVVAGTLATVMVSGTGFTSQSECVLAGGSLAAPRSTAGTLTGADLACPVDATALDAGVYTLKVRSEKGVLSSSSASLTVTPSDPVVYSVSPDHATTAAPVTLTILGDRFDSSSRVLFDAAQVPTTVFFGSSQLAVGRLDLTAVNAGPHTISVRNGSGAGTKVSNPVVFTVGGSPPAITGMTPPIAYQGDLVVPVTFNGTSLPADATLEVEPPGTTVFTTVAGGTTVTGGTRATATYSLVVGGTSSAPQGVYQFRLRYPSLQNSASAPWPMRVLSNQAILRDYAASPGPEQAGMVGDVKTGLQFQVSNIRQPYGAVKISFDSVSATSAIHWDVDPVDPTVATSDVLNVGPFSLAGLEAGTYTFTVVNPYRATPSNALTFAVTPGKPTLTAVCLSGAGCVQQAPQQDHPVTIRLTGTNFARKDASGNGSTVMIASEFSTHWPYGDPCDLTTTTGTQFEPAPITSVTVVSSTELLIQVDTRAAYADPSFGTTYYVGVWNPGSTGGVLKSSCKPSCAVPASCPYATAPAAGALPWFKVTAP